MTPEEIRNSCLEKLPKLYNQNETLTGIFAMLREIAAQLSELNKKLDNTLTQNNKAVRVFNIR